MAYVAGNVNIAKLLMFCLQAGLRGIDMVGQSHFVLWQSPVVNVVNLPYCFLDDARPVAIEWWW